MCIRDSAERGDEKAAAEAERGGKHGFSRTDAVEPSAGEGGGEAKKDDGDGEDPAELGELPVVRSGFSNADEPGHRQVEHAEGVDLADAKMHAERRRRHEPAAEAGLSYGVRAVEPMKDCLLYTSPSPRD